MDDLSEYDRDKEYRRIVQEQLGKNGMTLLTNVTFLYVLCLVVLLVMMVGFTATATDETELRQNGKTIELKTAAIVNTK
jgi:hypothetical protein